MQKYKQNIIKMTLAFNLSKQDNIRNSSSLLIIFYYNNHLKN